MKKIENIFYSDTTLPAHQLDIYLPDSDTFPVFIFFHGGGIELGDKHVNFCEFLTKKGVAVVSANYRMYPSATYPDFIRDAAQAVAWTMKHMSEYGNATGFFVGGSSAGGYLTQMLCFDKKYLAAHNVDADSISGYIMDAGQPTVHFNVLRERGIDSRRVIIDTAAPLYHVCEERNYPPMHIIVSDNDMENRYEQTMLLVSTLKHFGHADKVDLRLMENSTHCSYVDKFDEDGNSVFADMIYEFIAKHS